MYTAQITFKLTLEGSKLTDLELTATAVGITKDDAEAKAWQALANDTFNTNTILLTSKIEKITTKFI